LMVRRKSSAARAALGLTGAAPVSPNLPGPSQTFVYTRSPSPLSPVHCAIATVFVALPKALSKLGFAL
ncbi:hypothetical protein, partial [Pseudomonas plecoglossicida]|uniref:hypothetical protein n=1 Tax=Pseudomonas plecoglossicida TaxID=70775 RepID=UPI0019D45A84